MPLQDWQNQPHSISFGGPNPTNKIPGVNWNPAASAAGTGYVPGGVGGTIDGPGGSNIPDPFKTSRLGGFAPVGINPNRLPSYSSLPSYGLRPPSNMGSLGSVGTINSDTIDGGVLQGIPGYNPYGNPDMNVPASPAAGSVGMARNPLTNYGRGQNQGFYS